jgi:hypothetical protein
MPPMDDFEITNRWLVVALGIALFLLGMRIGCYIA